MIRKRDEGCISRGEEKQGLSGGCTSIDFIAEIFLAMIIVLALTE
jgi:hypothetical protein